MTRTSPLSLASVCSILVAACGGPGAREPHGWRDAPNPAPEEQIATAVLTGYAGSAITASPRSVDRSAAT